MSSLFDVNVNVKALIIVPRADKPEEDNSEEKADVLGKIRDLLMEAVKVAKVKEPDDIERVAKALVELEGAPEVFKTSVLLKERGVDVTTSFISPPTEAPELWRDRKKENKEPIVDFINRVYEPWLGKGLNRADILQVDPPLHRALTNHIQRNGEPTREALNLPTKAQQSKEILQMIQEGDIDSSEINPKLKKRLGASLKWDAQKIKK